MEPKDFLIIVISVLALAASVIAIAINCFWASFKIVVDNGNGCFDKEHEDLYQTFDIGDYYLKWLRISNRSDKPVAILSLTFNDFTASTHIPIPKKDISAYGIKLPNISTILEIPYTIQPYGAIEGFCLFYSPKKQEKPENFINLKIGTSRKDICRTITLK